MTMNSGIKKALIALGAYVVAYIILAPLGIGWLVTLCFLGGVIIYSLTRDSRKSEAEATPEHAQQNAEAEAAWPPRWKRGRTKPTAEDRQRQERERAQREADCGLTHDERVRFHDIIDGLNDDKA